MKNIKKEIPAIVGLVASASLAYISGGLVNSTTMSLLGKVGSSISTRLAANYICGMNPANIKEWFSGTHPNDLNHSIKKLFVASISFALNNISVLFAETNATEAEKKEAKKLIKELQKKLPEMLLDENVIHLEEPEIKQFLYENKNENIICSFIEGQFAQYGITEPFQSFLTQHLSPQLQLCFGEGLKDPTNRNAWIAFQRMLSEEIRNDIKQISDTQQSIKDDLSDLKFEKSGFSKEQLDEIRELIHILNNKKLIEVKIKNGIDISLQSIENKANEIIKITTQTQLSVDELKRINEKTIKQNRINQMIMYALAVFLVGAGIFIGYNFVNQPFTATINIYGWEGEQHNPLNGKGTVVLTLGEKIEKAEISRMGEAVFKGILPSFHGQLIPIHITDTEGEPYYFTDSLVKIEKNNTAKIQVLLRSLEKLQGTVFDNLSGEGVPDATVTVAGLSGKTDANGFFTINIPAEKQQHEQKVVISKEGYETKRETVSMTGEYNSVLKTIKN